MEEYKKKQKRRMVKEDTSLPFTKVNYILFGLGIVLIVGGFFALSKKPWDSFESLVIAPILLVLGYCVVIILGIIYHKKDKNSKNNQT